jgi:hypothetical protein
MPASVCVGSATRIMKRIAVPSPYLACAAGTSRDRLRPHDEGDAADSRGADRFAATRVARRREDRNALNSQYLTSARRIGRTARRDRGPSDGIFGRAHVRGPGIMRRDPTPLPYGARSPKETRDV